MTVELDMPFVIRTGGSGILRSAFRKPLTAGIGIDVVGECNGCIVSCEIVGASTAGELGGRGFSIAGLDPDNGETEVDVVFAIAVSPSMSLCVAVGMISSCLQIVEPLGVDGSDFFLSSATAFS